MQGSESPYIEVRSGIFMGNPSDNKKVNRTAETGGGITPHPASPI